MPEATTKEVIMIMMGEIVEKARSSDQSPRGKARRNGLRGMIPIGPTTRSSEGRETRLRRYRLQREMVGTYAVDACLCKVP